jgi:hypothetical protein
LRDGARAWAEQGADWVTVGTEGCLTAYSILWDVLEKGLKEGLDGVCKVRGRMKRMRRNVKKGEMGGNRTEEMGDHFRWADYIEGERGSEVRKVFW